MTPNLLSLSKQHLPRWMVHVGLGIWTLFNYMLIVSDSITLQHSWLWLNVLLFFLSSALPTSPHLVGIPSLEFIRLWFNHSLYTPRDTHQHGFRISFQSIPQIIMFSQLQHTLSLSLSINTMSLLVKCAYNIKPWFTLLHYLIKITIKESRSTRTQDIAFQNNNEL